MSERARKRERKRKNVTSYKLTPFRACCKHCSRGASGLKATYPSGLSCFTTLRRFMNASSGNLEARERRVSLGPDAVDETMDDG